MRLRGIGRAAQSVAVPGRLGQPWPLHAGPAAHALLAALPAGAVARTGEAIYRQMCVDCHCARGQGVAGK